MSGITPARYEMGGTYLPQKNMALEKNQPFIEAFAKRIRDLRIAKGYNMQELADMLNIDRKQLTRIEQGKVNTSILVAYSIAKALEIPLPELFTF
jgi:DNA-binding XRE family transcriptional regulator